MTKRLQIFVLGQSCPNRQEPKLSIGLLTARGKQLLGQGSAAPGLAERQKSAQGNGGSLASSCLVHEQTSKCWAAA